MAQNSEKLKFIHAFKVLNLKFLYRSVKEKLLLKEIRNMKSFLRYQKAV